MTSLDGTVSYRLLHALVCDNLTKHYHVIISYLSLARTYKHNTRHYHVLMSRLSFQNHSAGF